MASLNLFFTPIATTQRIRVRTAATAAKTSGGGSEEKGLLDFILGGLQKEDQFYETDPILKKVEGKNGVGGTATKSVAVSAKTKDGSNKNGGGGFDFGGLFAKK